MNHNLVTLLLLLGLRLTKRAQIPFSSWLPAAMAAPTPVRALVHSSTLVTAGVYILIRYCDTDLKPLLFIGRTTILMAGLCACMERDLKKVVAIRTLSQLGVMIVSLGAMEKSYCFFHLMSHASFKALLFICVGVCIHSGYGTQEYRSYRILWPNMHLSVAFIFANLTLIGFFFTSGFYSKDIILESIYTDGQYAWATFIFLVGIGFTCFYSCKIIYTIEKIYDNGVAPCTIGGLRWLVKFPLISLGI